MNFGIEDETTEYKTSTSELKEAMRSMCAMLNKKGFGTIYFGIHPNGEVHGLIVNESTLRDISRKVYESIYPPITPDIQRMNVDDLQIIKLSFSGTDKPYSCKGTYYIRSADEDRLLPQNELRQMFEYNKKGSWDEQLTSYSLLDLDIDALSSFYKRAISIGRIKDEDFVPETILVKLGLLKDNKLTNAAHILFGKDKPVKLNLAVFATDEKLSFLDINTQNGNIYSLIDTAYQYIKKNINWKADIYGFKREEIPEIPLRSLREIICNSFAHARYEDLTQHEITIHPGKIRIYNPGEFPIGYIPEDFVKEDIPSLARNPLILKILYLSGDVESYSSGFKRVYKECEEYNVKTEYQMRKEGFTFIFKRNNSNIKPNKAPLDKEERIIIDLVKDDPYMSANKISKILNKSPRSIQRVLAKLKQNGYIDHIGQTRGYWQVIDR